MPIQCRFINLEEEKEKNPDFKLQPGDMWYDILANGEKGWLYVKLPNGLNINLTLMKEKWDRVEGEPPKIDVWPSIATDDTPMYPAWHGYLINGILYNDHEERP